MQGYRSPRNVVRFGLVVLGVLSWSVLAAGASAGATAGERIGRYTIDLHLAVDGSMDVKETIEYDFGPAHRHGIKRTIVLRSRYDSGHDREYPIDRIAVFSPTGAPVQRAVTPGPTTEVRIGDPADDSVTGKQTYVVSYHLKNVVTTVAGHQELYWNAIGTEWAVPIDTAAVTVSGPAAVLRSACFDGVPGSKHPCPTTIETVGAADFTAPRLSPGHGMTVVASFPSGTFPNAVPILRSRWTWGEAFSLTPATIGAALALFLLLGGTAVIAVLRNGRDEYYLGLVPGLEPGFARRRVIRREPWWHRTPIAVRFTPPDEMRPGQLGTLLHERARPVDVTATVVDLAVRGFIRIDRVGEHDWRLTQLPRPSGRAGLMSIFEGRLFDSVFRGRDHILLSQLQRTFRGTLRSVEARLELDVTERGWFKALPSQVRRRWAGAGVLLTVLGAALTWLLAARTSAGLLGVAVLLSGLLLLALAPRMPARTAKGTALLVQAKGFREYLEKAEAHQIRFEEGEDHFSRYLPYAIVLGVADRWAQIFGELAESGRTGPAPAWFVDRTPSNLTPNFPALCLALADFTASTSAALDGSNAGGSSLSAPSSASTITSFSASGLGGGGSTGGGGGGGGGGSW